MLIAVVIVGLIMSVGYLTLNVGRKSFETSTNQLSVLQRTQIITTKIGRNWRQAVAVNDPDGSWPRSQLQLKLDTNHDGTADKSVIYKVVDQELKFASQSGPMLPSSWSDLQSITNIEEFKIIDADRLFFYSPTKETLEIKLQIADQQDEQIYTLRDAVYNLHLNN